MAAVAAVLDASVVAGSCSAARSRSQPLSYECTRNQGFFVGTPEPKQWHMDVPFTCTSSLFGRAPAYAEKSPLYRDTVGTCFTLFYSFLFVLILIAFFVLILIAFAIAVLCRHSSLLLYKIELRTTLSPAISRLPVETAPLAPPFQNRAQPAFPSLTHVRRCWESQTREYTRLNQDRAPATLGGREA